MRDCFPRNNNTLWHLRRPSSTRKRRRSHARNGTAPLPRTALRLRIVTDSESFTFGGFSTPQQIAQGLNERSVTAVEVARPAVKVRRILKGSRAYSHRVTEDSPKGDCCISRRAFDKVLLPSKCRSVALGLAQKSSALRQPVWDVAKRHRLPESSSIDQVEKSSPTTSKDRCQNERPNS